MTTTSSRPSSRIAPSAIRSPPPNDGPLATATSIASSWQLLTVEVDLVVERLERPQLGDRGQVVAHLAARPGHLVGALVDDRVEPGGEHGHEPAVAGSSQVDPPRLPCQQPSDGACGVPQRDADRTRGVVAGAGRQDAERYVGAADHLQREVHQPVTTAHDQRLDAVGHGLAREIGRLVGVAALERPDPPAGSVEQRQRRIAHSAGATLARRGIGEEGDLAGHGAQPIDGVWVAAIPHPGPIPIRRGRRGAAPRSGPEAPRPPWRAAPPRRGPAGP